MKTNFLFVAAILFAVLTQSALAQERYLDEVFTQTEVTSNVVYGQNFTVLYGDPLQLQDLAMDVYQPAGDTAQLRPLVIYIHTGQFFPLLANQTPTGDKADSATAEMCRQFARRGYVAASMDYRTGWNPGGSTQDIRTGTILLAVYRALQDAKACVRFFKMNATTQGNPYKIDTGKIMICGQGSGGYVALAYASLDTVTETQMLKFIAAETDLTYGFVAGEPYANPSIWGDIDGFGGTAGYSYSNWPGYSNKIRMIVNMGGAIGDSSWIESGDVPMVAFHPVNDPFAPYYTGPVIVPSTGQFVVEVSGSYDVIKICNDPTRGNNNAVFDIPYNDPYTTRANSINDGHEGLFPFILPDPGPPFYGQAGPWEWWDTAALKIVAPAYGINPADVAGISAGALLTNPDMSKTKALKYIDSIQGYLAPRIVQALKLPGFYSSVNEISVVASGAAVYPNPSKGDVTIQLDDNLQSIHQLQLYDLSGKMLRNITSFSSNTIQFKRGDLPLGCYILKIDLTDKSIRGKIIFE